MDESRIMRTRSALLGLGFGLGLGLSVASCAAFPQVIDVGARVPAAVALAVRPPPPAHAMGAGPAEISALPKDAGRETTIRVCSGCHAVELVAEKRLTRGEWFTMVQFMGDRGAMGTPAEFAEITDYLAKAFPKE